MASTADGRIQRFKDERFTMISDERLKYRYGDLRKVGSCCLRGLLPDSALEIRSLVAPLSSLKRPSAQKLLRPPG